MTDRVGPSVLWREGMFLCPHHLQAFARELNGRTVAGDEVGPPGSFGLIRLEVDEDALERDVFRVIECDALFKDGTFASIPRNAQVEQREFAEHFTGETLDVWIGFPAVHENVPQIGTDNERAYRFDVETRPTFDENERDATRDLDFKTLRGQLFFGDENRAGFECVAAARLVRVGRPEAVSALSPDWVAPSLRCGASKALRNHLNEAAGKARSQARDLAASLPDTTKLSSIDKAADLTGLMKLQATNRCVAGLELIANAPDLHPFFAFAELSRTVGELAIFSDDRVMPALPPYEHGELDGCVASAITQLHELLKGEVAVPYDTVPFQEDPSQEGTYFAAIAEEWTYRHPIWFLGIELEGTPEEAVELVTAGVKLLAPEDFEHVVTGVLPGVGLEHVRMPPLSFPKRTDLHYFRIESEGESRERWLKILNARKATILSALSTLGLSVSYSLYVELRD